MFDFLTRLARRLREERGSTATAFALLAVPLTVAIGGAGDYLSIQSSRNALPDATDAAALAVVTQAAGLAANQLAGAASPFVTAKFKSA